MVTCGSARDEYAARYGFVVGSYMKRFCTVVSDGSLLNIRLDPVSLREMPPATVREEILRRVPASGNPSLTGVCCINMDRDMPDGIVATIFETVEQCRRKDPLDIRPAMR